MLHAKKLGDTPRVAARIYKKKKIDFMTLIDALTSG
jgi:hypothetical protein